MLGWTLSLLLMFHSDSALCGFVLPELLGHGCGGGRGETDLRGHHQGGRCGDLPVECALEPDKP